jgi:uncharacterized protein YndB with AHSA1/START domain
MATSTDRIEKRVFLRASRARVWRALSDAGEFGNWFGLKLEGAFAPGARITGKILHPDYAHLPFVILIERMEPERLLSWRAPPHPAEPGKASATEATTEVVFTLEDAPGGTLLTVVESGFDGIPLPRRAEVYRGNEEGWTVQMENIARYVSPAA